MKKYNFYFTIIVLSFFITSFSSTKSNDCAEIKNGKFYYYSKISRDKVDVERFDSMQLETNTKNGHVLRSKIIWINECNYDMYINALSNSKLEKMDSLISVTPTSVEIISVNSTWYICHWKMKILSKEIEGSDTIYFKADNKK